MKPETLQTLITARTLLEKSQELCLAEDKYLASAGLLILQDGLELALFACLLEIGADEDKSLERLSFDELISELRKRDKKIMKSGTLKALNRERVNVKHYGQLAEPASVKTYFTAASFSIEKLLQDVVGKGLQEVMLDELITPGEAKDMITEACVKLSTSEYYEALIVIRKAIYIEIEENYSIEGWKDYDSGSPSGFLDTFHRGGDLAPWFAKNAEWINMNVPTPFHYIQIDHDNVRSQLMEWGISTQDFWNICRLTPKVFRFKKTGEWITFGEPDYLQKAANEGNVRYCLDRAVSIILNKQLHSSRMRDLENRHQSNFYIRLKQQGKLPVYKKASVESTVIAELDENITYGASAYLRGFDTTTMFILVTHSDMELKKFVYGYVVAEGCEIV